MLKIENIADELHREFHDISDEGVVHSQLTPVFVSDAELRDFNDPVPFISGDEESGRLPRMKPESGLQGMMQVKKRMAGIHPNFDLEIR